MKLALALLAAPVAAFVPPGQQSASKVVVSGDIGVDPGPIKPQGIFWDDKESLARCRVRQCAPSMRERVRERERARRPSTRAWPRRRAAARSRSSTAASRWPRSSA